MNTTEARPPATAGQCEHLGIKDDPRTCLAFPSTWNYCHRARPAASVRLDHQRQFCQRPEHVQCPVFQGEKTGPLPVEIRGRHLPKTHRHRARWRIPALAISLALALALVWFIGAGRFLGRAGQPQASEAATGAPATELLDPASPSSALPTLAPLIPPLVVITTDVPTIADFSMSNQYTDPSPATATPVSTAAGLCGHQLDVPFGPGPKFIIHRVGGGDSLNRYEIDYHTSVAAIQGINLPYQIPVRADWILVIPLDTKEVSDLPVFKPYLVSNRNTAIQTMAFKVSADLLAFQKYNGFDDSCRDFVGWVLSPRQRPSP